MSKSILVMDTPENCGQCPCFLEVATDCCGVNGRDIDGRGKPDWCPLKDVPEKKNVRNFCLGEKDFEQKGYQQGYNVCIDEILKGDGEE